MRSGIKILFGLLLVTTCWICHSEIRAQGNQVSITTCEDIAGAGTSDAPGVPLQPTQDFKLKAGKQHVGFFLKFSSFSQLTRLQVILQQNGPNGEQLNRRSIAVLAGDTTAVTSMTIYKPGNYFARVTADNEAGPVLGTTVFRVSEEPLEKLSDYFPFIAIAVLLIALTTLEWLRPRRFTSLKRWYGKPITVTSVVTGVVLLIAISFEKSGHNLLQNSNLLGILGLIGIVGTIIGVVLTYEQLKLAEDRIEGYDKFYEVLHELFNDPKSQFLQFSGSTIIPGQVASGDARLIERYKTGLDGIANHLDDPTKITLIVPSDEQYERAYMPYVGKTIGKTLYDVETIMKKIDQALRYQHSFKTKSHTIEVKLPEEIAILNAFYYSNGRTVVYAVPLHYDVAKVDKLEHDAAKQDRKLNPVLIGFKTTNSSIITAFHEYFEKLTSELDR